MFARTWSDGCIEVPRYRMQLSRPRAGHLSRAEWVPAPRFDIAAHAGHATLPVPGGDEEMDEWFADFVSHRLDRRRPLWEAVLLDGLAGGRWALATKTHHCLVDGMGSVDVGRILLDSRAVAQAATAAGPLDIEDPQREHARPLASVPGPAGQAARRPARGTLRHPVDALARAAAVADVVIHEELSPRRKQPQRSR